MRAAALCLASAILGCGTYAGRPPDAAGVGGVGGDGSGDDAGVAAPDLAASGPPADAPLGATPYPGGTRFRVWAPHAAHVFVVGDFNAWSATANELAVESGATGIFGGDVAGAIAGQQYAYAVALADGTVATRPDPRARLLTASTNGRSVIVDARAYAWKTPAFTPAAFADTVIYEMHLGTFARATPTTIGTWTTAAAKLDYLQALGISAVEIMPPALSPGDSTWGYSPSWPFATHNAYGSPDDVRAFVDAAHARGIAVYIDVVHNHYSSKTGLWCWDGDCGGSGNGGAYFYPDATRRGTPWGPRPDFSDAAVRGFIRDNALMWLDEYRCDGLRWDSTISIRATTWGPSGVPLPDGAAMLRELNDAVHALPHKLQIAEDLQTDATITKATSGGGAGFDTQWDAAFFHPVDDNLLKPNDADRDLNAIRDAITHAYNGSATQRVIYTEDHDEVANGKSRIPEMISPGDAGSLVARQRSTVGAAVVMTSPGIPMIFMGQEFLESGHFADTIPLDWSKTTRYAGILQLYTDLIQLRRNAGGHTRGLAGEHVDVFHLNATAKVLAWRRWDQGGPGDDVIIVANFSAKPFARYDLGLPRAGAWKVRFSSNDTKYSADFAGTATGDVATSATARDGFAQFGSLALGPYQVLILSQ
ncbi:MAG: 1,4-alpha-glucan-branching protein [Myxococcales bacterium]|nr:1,4-alpha-glucan-branching protein [Myxococcales bacterium]